MSTKEKKRVVSKKKQAKSRKSLSASVKKKPVSDKVRKPANGKKNKEVLAVSKHGSKCPTEAMKAKVKRDRNGHVLKGSGSNGGGRPKGTFRPSLKKFNLNEIKQAILEFELKHLKKSKRTPTKYKKWLEHQIAKSYDDTALAIVLLKMQYATLKSVEQHTFDSDAMDDSEAAEICKIRREMDERCERVIKNVERKIKSLQGD